MSKTNFEKLVRWDADFYKSLSNDECIVCLSEREIYLVGQITEMLKWKNTRWVGDLSDLDLALISENLEYKLSERMTCQNITKLLEKIVSLEDKIDYIFNDTTINNGDTIITEDTPAWDAVTPEEFAEEFSISTDGCDNDDKNEIYSGVYQLVRYVNQVNIDALQQLAQAGNLAQQIDKLISAATGGLTPLDEVAGYVDFLVTELLDEYEATVDEELLEQVTCDLFCIAVSSNCTINLADVVNYYGSKLGSTALDLTNSLLDVVQFALTGTFSGDEYFYFMTTFQFITAALTDHFFNVNNMDNYKIQVLAGMNSPDADWTLLCDACPALYRLKTYNFAYGEQGWAISTIGISSTHGVWSGDRWEGTLNQFGEKVIQIVLNDHLASHRLRGIKIYTTRINGTMDGNKDTSSAWLRPIADSGTGQINIQSTGGVSNGDIVLCSKATASPFYWTNGVQLAVTVTVNDNGGTGQIYLTKIELLYELNYAPLGSIITEDSDICA